MTRRAAESLACTAAHLGLSENALNFALHHLRRRFRERVEEQMPRPWPIRRT
jgi:hypothetical protein